MDYEQTASALQKFVGKPVIVVIGQGVPPNNRALGCMHGVLRGTEEDQRWGGETLWFRVGDETAFVLSDEAFRDGWWQDSDEGRLILRIAWESGCETVIFLDRDSESPSDEVSVAPHADYSGRRA
jgi:hypothetical protein